MKNLSLLVSFTEAAAAGSFTAAAAKLDLTPAAVSKNIARLERELGVRLFNRSTRRMRLTAEGAAFRARAATALRELDEAMAEVGHARDAAVGRVRISVGVSFGRRYLLPLVLVASPGYLQTRRAPRSITDLTRHELLGVRLPGGGDIPWHFRRPSGRGTTTLVIGKSCCTTRIDSIWRRVCASPSMRCWKDSRETRICMPRATRCPIRARPEESPQTRAGIRHFGYIRLA